MQNFEKSQILEDIKNSEKNIESAKEAIKNAEIYLYNQEQFLILYKNRLNLLNTKNK